MKNYLLLIIPAFIFSMESCTKNTEDGAGISDATLSSMATTQDGFVLMRTAKHDENSTWKIKMNNVAATSYAEGCKSFPSNSMIVKEKFDLSGNVIGYDVMYRSDADHNSNDGWLWAQLSADGRIIYSSSERGSNCQGCHAFSKSKTLH